VKPITGDQPGRDQPGSPSAGVHRSRSRIGAAAVLSSSAARAAVGVALERQPGSATGSAARGAPGQRPTAPTSDEATDAFNPASPTWSADLARLPSPGDPWPARCARPTGGHCPPATSTDRLGYVAFQNPQSSGAPCCRYALRQRLDKGETDESAAGGVRRVP
jgi:hypothetical protein